MMTNPNYFINPQRELWSFLKEGQRKEVARVLRPLKPYAQGRLATTMLDYMEGGRLVLMNDVVLDAVALYLVSGDGKRRNPIIRPLKAQADEGCDQGMAPNSDFESEGLK